MEALIKALPAVLRASGNAPEVAEAAAIAAWKHCAGEGLKERAVPFALRDRTLMVAVADLIWQKQMMAMRGEMLYKINKLLGQRVVGAFEFIIDPEKLCR
ncbi:MAG TPA: DciA family protein [Pyrinomonadaceae bacterium]|nr:DciA family protein [Pyrinomonadaceae bacterium]